MNPVPHPAPGATARERLFMECDNEGRILWMNERARVRLGVVGNLFEAVPSSRLREAQRLVRAREPGDQPSLTCRLERSGRPRAVPVEFVRVLASESNVLLSAEVRERASDERPSIEQGLQLLLQMQRRATHNYFRLLRARELLERQSRPTTPVGKILSEALEMERTRLARELHSGTGQTLAGIKLNVELIRSRLPDPPEPVRSGLARIEALADDTLSHVRSVSQRLHPPDWQQLGLREAIELLWNTTGIPDKFRATLEIRPMEVEPPHAVRVAIYRAAQEGLSNVLRHSGATQVRLELDQRNGRIHLALEDNGVGFEAQQVLRGRPSAAMRGIGLRAMREEVLALNGVLDITSGPRGTRMEVFLPLTEQP